MASIRVFSSRVEVPALAVSLPEASARALLLWGATVVAGAGGFLSSVLLASAALPIAENTATKIATRTDAPTRTFPIFLTRRPLAG